MVWRLRNVLCPCCGQGLLRFEACPTCNHLVLGCDELGSVFALPGPGAKEPEPLYLWSDETRPDEQLCPRCQQSRIASFESATSEEIRAAGFGPEEYE